MTAPASAADLAAVKRAARQAAMQARDRFHALHGAAATRALADHGLGFLGARAPSVVSGFHAFRSEIDVIPLLARLAAEGWRTALPVVAGKGRPLGFRAWAPGEPTTPGVWAIEAPPESAAAVDPDVLLVPMLAFDRRGFRLGYGGGFYDRTLTLLRGRKTIAAVGVAYSVQELPAVPRGAHDAPLDWVLTERGAFRPEPGA